MKKASSFDKMVSVILCNYNYGQFISEAIDSVLRQTYDNIELIIVDDGSTDNSREIISRYSDNRIKNIFKENGGQASSFNAGYEIATGEYIAFLDSDDVWTPDKLERSVPFFEDDNFSVVQHNMVIIDADSSITDRIHPGVMPGSKNVLREYVRKNHTDFFSATSGILCKKMDLDKVFPLDMSWRICADIAITRPLPLFGNVCTLPFILGYYRIHGSNNWMNTAAQGLTIENAERDYIYVNYWLEKYGFKARINFEESKYFKQWMAEQLPKYHPLRIVNILKQILWWRGVYPFLVRLKISKSS